MADKTGEQLSTLLDGECSTAELELALRRLAKDADLKACWQRYHLISDALKNHLPDTINSNFSERIRHSIETAPPLPSSIPASRPTRYRPLVGVGLAASVAVAGLFGVQWYQADFANGRTGAPAGLAQKTPTQQNSEYASRLSSYLVNHNEYASMNNVHGVLPYVRMVGYEINR